MWQPKANRVCIIKETGELGVIIGKLATWYEQNDIWYVQITNDVVGLMHARMFTSNDFETIGWLG